jgi:hypothetical protein
MKSKEEIEYLAANLANPNVCKTTNWIEGYTQCQEDMAKDVEYWQGEFDHWHQQAMQMAVKKYTEEDVIKLMFMATKWDTFKENDVEYSMDMSDFFQYLINSLNKQD